MPAVQMPELPSNASRAVRMGALRCAEIINWLSLRDFLL